ncbi:hypothetical protein L1049_017384 [Liquidambar formosana]|uniref:RRM domain-containing protein n=1 Tax=Liquidambar formosana TaxID=63359 RepID=A0AAP0S322_LIQFO
MVIVAILKRRGTKGAAFAILARVLNGSVLVVFIPNFITSFLQTTRDFVALKFRNPNFGINRPKISTTSISISYNSGYSSPQRLRCCASSSSSTDHDESPSSIIFIKGLPQSTSEGSLKRAFSQFGEVSRVKIIMDKKSRQPLGFAYVWFTSEESAQLAVKEMDGKFFDGRFVFVTIAKPGSCKSRVKTTPYRF